MNTENPPLLYLLTEDENDDIFFQRCAERISRKTFCLVPPKRIRKNGGDNEVENKLDFFLNDIKKSERMDAFFIIALDNDCAPEHLIDDNQELIHNRIPGLLQQDKDK